MDKREALILAKNYLEFLKEKKYDFLDAYIFGSYVKGTNTENSDIDIAIIFKKLRNRFDTRVELMKLGRKIDLRIEPHPFEKEDLNEMNPFLKEVIQTGIEI
jgi:uncharacterized protein